MANLSVTLQADTAGFNAAMDKAKTVVDNFSKTIESHKDLTSGQVQAYNRVVNSLGKVTDGTKTAQQQQKILTQNINELKIQFANLSSAAKAGDFGKSISNSIKAANTQLTQLKTQMQQASASTKSYANENTNAAGASNGLSDALSVGLLRFGKLGIAIMAAKQAFDPLMSVMKENETAVDELGMAWSAAESAFTAFKITLTTADFSSLLRSFDEIIKKGREAYYYKDLLGTNTGIRSNKLAKLRAEDAKDTEIINNKKSTPQQIKAAQDRIKGRKGEIKKAAQNEAKENLKVVEVNIKKRLAEAGITEKTVGKKKFNEIYNNVNKSLYTENPNIGTYQKDRTKFANIPTPFIGLPTIPIPIGKEKTTVNLNDLFGDEYRDKNLNPYIQAAHNAELQSAQYGRKMNRFSQKTVTTPKTSTTRKTTTTPKTTTPPPPKTGLEKLEEDLSKLEKTRSTMPIEADFTEINKQIEAKKKEIEAAEIKLGIKEDPKAVKLSDFKKFISEATQEKKQTSSFTTAFSNAGGNTDEDKTQMDANNDRIRAIEEEMNANDALISTLQELIDTYKELENTDPYKDAVNTISELTEKNAKLGKEVGDVVANNKKLTKAQKKQEKAAENIETWQSSLTGVGDVFNSVGDAVGGTTGQIMNMTSTVLSTTAQMIPQIISLTAAEGSEALAAVTKSGAALPYPANIFAIAAGVAAVVAALSTTFADGGIFGGTGTVGDLNIARVNKGEMILNGTQQSRLFNLLNGQGGYSNTMAGGNEVKFIIKGKNLEGVRNNYYKRQSRL